MNIDIKQVKYHYGKFIVPDYTSLEEKQALLSGINEELVEKLSALSSTPNKPFNPEWKTDTTLSEFCSDVVNDSSVVVGDMFLGGLSCEGLPENMVYGEVSVEVLNGSAGIKLLRLILTSTNLPPYHWEASYFNGFLYGWRAFALEEEGITSVKISGNNTNLKNDKTVTLPAYPTKTSLELNNVTNDALVKRSEMGTASGVATLNENGKVPSTQLPSYVDDVLEFDTQASFPETGETGKIYIDKTTKTSWRWSGSIYSLIKGDLSIGTTTGTAADGAVVNNHISSSNNPHSVTASLVGLGNVGNFKAVSTVANQELTDTEKGNARTNIGALGESDKISMVTINQTGVYLIDENLNIGAVLQNTVGNIGLLIPNIDFSSLNLGSVTREVAT